MAATATDTLLLIAASVVIEQDDVALPISLGRPVELPRVKTTIVHRYFNGVSDKVERVTFGASNGDIPWAYRIELLQPTDADRAFVEAMANVVSCVDVDGNPTSR